MSDRSTLGRVATTLVVAMLVASAAIAGVGGAAAAQTDEDGEEFQPADEIYVEDDGAGVGGTAAAQTEEDGEEFPPADEIYVKENGDAVLVYENESADARGEFGLDVAESVFYALVVDENPDVREGTEGELSAELTPDRFSANGYVDAPLPSQNVLRDLSVNLEGESTDENSQFDLDAQAELNTTEARTAALLNSATTSGEVTTTPSRFQASGNFSAELATRLPASQTRERSVTLTENEGDYTLEDDRSFVARGADVDRFSSESNARRTLSQQYSAVAARLGGSATLTINSYSFNSETNRVDIAYTVEFSNIDEGLADRIARSLTEAESVDLTSSEANEIANQITDLSVEELSATVDVDARSSSGEFTVDFRNYDQVVLASFEIAEATETETARFSNLSRARETFAAQRAAGLEQTFSWSGSFSQLDRRTARISVGLEYRTKNWAAYREELASRGITSPDTTYQLSVEKVGDRINASGSLEVSATDLVDRGVDTAFNASEMPDPELRRFAEIIRRAEFRKARLDVAFNKDRVRLEAGAKFENLEAARDALIEERSDFPRFTSIVGRTDEGTTRSYVRVDGAVGSGASEAEVRELPYVDEETRVFLPDEWDPAERDFPEVDTERARDYLGLAPGEPPTDGTGEPSISVQPADTPVPTSGERTVNIVLENASNGVAAYDLDVSVGDTSTAEITAVSDATGGTPTKSVASGGGSANIAAVGAGVSGSGTVTLATVTVRGNAAGETTLTVTSNGISDSANDAYSLAAVRGATLRVAENVGPPPVCPGGSAPTDPDGDNVFEDANGDGSFDIFDVQCLLNNFDTTAVQNNTAAFDFTGDNSVDIFDIQAALNEV